MRLDFRAGAKARMLVTAVLASCAVGGAMAQEIPADKLKTLQAQATTDEAEQRERWGPWVDLMGKVWVIDRYANVIGFELQWVVPGSAVSVTTFTCSEPGTPCAVHKAVAMHNPKPAQKRLFGLVKDFDYLWPDGKQTEGHVHDRETVMFTTQRSGISRFKFDAAKGKGFWGTFDFRPAKPEDLTRVAKFGVSLSPQAAAAAGASAVAAAAAFEAAVGPLKTEDPGQIKARWGALGQLVGRSYLTDSSGSPVWRELAWIVPGAAMRYDSGYCQRGKCDVTRFVARFNPNSNQLDFSIDDTRVAGGVVRPDGSVVITRTILASETVDIDPATKAFKSDDYVLQPVPADRIAEVSKGLAGTPQVAQAGVPAAAAVTPVVAAAAAAAAAAPPRQPRPLKRTTPEWSPVQCSDAAYGGRPAMRCETSSFSAEHSGYLDLKVWASPALHGRVVIQLDELRTVERYSGVPADPIEFLLDDKLLARVRPSDLADNDITTQTIALSAAQIEEIQRAGRLVIRYTEKDGTEGLATYPVDPARLQQLAASARAGHAERFGASRVPAKTHKPDYEPWGPLGAAADRSRFWVNREKDYIRQAIELQWVERDKVMQVRQWQCKETCEEASWTLQLTHEAWKDGEPATGILLLNESGKAFARFTKPYVLANSAKRGLTMHAPEFDPVVRTDLKRALGDFLVPDYFAEPKADPCCFLVGAYMYKPGLARDVQAIVAETEATAAKSKRDAAAQASARAQAEADARRRDDEARRRRQQDDDDFDREQAARRGSIANTFLSTLQRELQAGNARDARQAQFLGDLQRRIGATAPIAQPQPRPQPAPVAQPIFTPPPAFRPPTQVALNDTPVTRPPVSRPELAPPREEPRSKLSRVLEAVVVCTKPDSAGNFECDTPVDVNLRGGPKNDLVARRTPESMIASLSASCPGAHRLPSTTHLVWGCGFGATNNANSMDRSAGVDVRDRASYFCSERETSCRRTQP